MSTETKSDEAVPEPQGFNARHRNSTGRSGSTEVNGDAIGVS